MAIKSRIAFIALMVIVAALMSANMPSAQSFASSFCAGTSSGGGVIPTTNILSGKGGGEQSIINISLLIMLTMLLVVALLYIISYVLDTQLLRNLAKAEIGEIFITLIIIGVFIGTFNLGSSAFNSSNALALGGSSFGRNLYVNDCTYLTTTSLQLLFPLFSINIARLFLNTLTSVKLTYEPALFGLSVSPLLGYSLINSAVGVLVDATWAFIISTLGVTVMLGFIWGVFPIFLYAGIILRTLPWTRAAGGAFLGLFAGFYIVFPMILHVMLAGYVSSITTVVTSSNPTQIGSLIGTVVGGATGAELGLPGILSSFGAYIGGFWGTAAAEGLIGGYLNYVLEPAAFTIFAIIISFIISFDFAEAMGDLLGAPSLSASNIWHRVL
ncbi:MAG: hypothetical protein ACREBH_02355 [Candidatus Micrarchaeaceae archaeon]